MNKLIQLTTSKPQCHHQFDIVGGYIPVSPALPHFIHPHYHLYFQEAATGILKYQSIFIEQFHQLPNGGWGVRNSGKPTDVIVERSLIIIHSRKEFFEDTACIDCEDVQEEKEVEEASENGIKGAIDIVRVDDKIDILFLAVCA